VMWTGRVAEMGEMTKFNWKNKVEKET